MDEIDRSIAILKGDKLASTDPERWYFKQEKEPERLAAILRGEVLPKIAPDAWLNQIEREEQKIKFKEAYEAEQFLIRKIQALEKNRLKRK